MSLGRLWTGTIAGTHSGRVFAELVLAGDRATGTLKVNETSFGIIEIAFAGEYLDGTLKIRGDIISTNKEAESVRLFVSAKMNSRGDLIGEWTTTVGAAGVIELYSREDTTLPSSNPEDPVQLHTARFDLNAIEIARSSIIQLATQLQGYFGGAQAIITVFTGTQQARVLNDFSHTNFVEERAEYLKIYCSEVERNGIVRSAQIEFGPSINFISVQGSDEAWILGTLERLKLLCRQYNRSYVTSIKKFGFGFSQMPIAAGIVYSPEIEILQYRLLFFVAMVLVTFSINSANARYLPNATIYIREKSSKTLVLLWPSLLSWIIAFTSVLVVVLIAQLLPGTSSQ